MSNINFKKNLFGNYYILEYQLNNGYPLEKYLENEDAIMCTRNMSDKVKKYFNSEIIKQLIKYITEEPEEDDLLKGHKYPYVASEILKSDCPFILQRFILSEKEYYNEYKEILDEINEEKNNDDDSSSNSSSEEENENKNKNEDENGIIFVNEDEQNNNEINKEKIIDDNNNNDKENVNNNDIENKSIELNKNNNNKNEDFNNDKKENEEILDDKKNIDNDKDKQRVNIEEKEIKKEEKNIDNNPENDINEINNKNNIENKQNEKDEEKNIQKKEENNNVKETDIKINKEKMEINNDIAKNENQKTDLNENEKINYEKKEEEIKGKDLINNNKENSTYVLKDDDIKIQKDKNINSNELINKEVDNDNEEKEKVENKEYNDDNSNEIEIGNKVDSVSFGSDSEYNENQNNEYFDLLLDFVMNDKPELNYVLSGYFSNVILTLLEKYPFKVYYYLYTVRKDALKKIIFRSHQRVFSIISSKLLNLENNDKLKESNKFLDNYINFRNELISDSIKSISLDGFKDDNNNLYNNIDIESKIAFICSIINDNKYVLEYILEKNDIYGHILSILDINLYEEKYCDNNFDNKYFIYGLLIDLISKILKCSYNSQNFELPKDFLSDNVEKEKSMLTFND